MSLQTMFNLEPLKRAIQAGIPSSPSSFLVKYRRRVQGGFPCYSLQKMKKKKKKKKTAAE